MASVYFRLARANGCDQPVSARRSGLSKTLAACERGRRVAASEDPPRASTQVGGVREFA